MKKIALIDNVSVKLTDDMWYVLNFYNKNRGWNSFKKSDSTTRKLVNKLVEYGFLEVLDTGNYDQVRITDKGIDYYHKKPKDIPSDIYFIDDPRVKKNTANNERTGLSSYLEALEFADEEQWFEDGVERGQAELSDDLVRKAKKDWSKFWKEAQKLADTFGEELDPSQTGHDFWFTRNGHGVGFWEADHTSEELGNALTKLSKRFGEVTTYVGDDGLIYIYP